MIKNLTNNVFNLLPHLYTINPALQLEVYTRQKDVYNRDIYYIVPKDHEYKNICI